MLLGIKRLNVRVILAIGGLLILALVLRVLWKGQYYTHLMEKIHALRLQKMWSKRRKMSR